jgi:alcohol dehydrogenase, propanol-preferring
MFITVGFALFVCVISFVNAMVLTMNKLSPIMTRKLRTQEAAVVRNGKISLESSVEVPHPQKHQILVKILASGCCHTDVHALKEDWPFKPKRNLITGHEGVGTIEEVGDDVKTLSIGDRVGIPWLGSACGVCDMCIGGNENLCPRQVSTGYSVDGCHAEYVVADAKYTALIPSGLTSEQAAPILCAGLTVYKAIKDSGVRPGQYLVITGASGGLGSLALQYGNAMGLRCIAVVRGQEKANYVRSRYSPFLVVDSTDMVHNAVHHINEVTHGGAHAAVNTAPSLEAMELTIQMLRTKGTLVAVGIPPGDVKINVPRLIVKGITIKGSLVGTRLDLKEALDFAARGLVHVDVDIQPLANIAKVFEMLEHGRIKGRIVFHTLPITAL